MFARILTTTTFVLLTACGADDPSFSLLPTSNEFQSTSSFNNKIDILWVVDNSGSMNPYQVNVANNFTSFIQDFQTKGYDFRIAVTTTDAWRANFYGIEANKAAFQDASGSAILDPSTPNLEDAFIDNIMVGASGFGDERAFQSFKTALESSLNSSYDFPRSDAFFAVIIVSDEDDFSHNTADYAFRNYNYGLHTISEYTEFLDNLTNSTDIVKNYNVSAIAALNQACVDDPDAHPDTIIGQRYMELVEATDGIQGSICDNNFSDNLNQIQTKISELSTRFYLNRTPVDGTIQVFINGGAVPEDPVNGWQYDEVSNSVTFFGSYIPAEGDSITVNYDPTDLLL
tara:strand:- start:1578 stop:2606 length:1029 start_codon:yes stop_codon:yes gene_type:complete